MYYCTVRCNVVSHTHATPIYGVVILDAVVTLTVRSCWPFLAVTGCDPSHNSLIKECPPMFDDASAATLCSSLCVSDDIWCQLLTDCCLLLSSNTTRSDFIFYSDRLVSCQPCFQTYPPTGLEGRLRYLFLFLLSLTDPPGGGGRTKLSTILQTHCHHSNW